LPEARGAGNLTPPLRDRSSCTSLDPEVALRSLLRRIHHALVVERAPAAFPFWERHGLHVVRATYDSPIPDCRSLDESIWRTESEMVGIDLRIEDQKRLLAEIGERYGGEYGAFPRRADGAGDAFYLENGAFGSVDAELLYGILRRFRPRKVIEVGCGFSTRCAAMALLANERESGVRAELTTVDPYAPDVASIAGVTRHLPERVEKVSLAELTDLDDGDVLFIDSPHVVTAGGAVQRLFLEVLPRLRPGVLVHVHDIFLPAEYPRSWLVEERRFYNEQYLLAAFLMFNTRFRVLWAGHLMHLRHPELLRSAIPSYDPSRDRPGSFWMRREPAGDRAGS
jgi:predicted O-methyltransferase YrrM